MAIQGADRVNDELEVGFDRRFERRWYRAEIFGRVLMVSVVAAALLGLLGQGPFSHATRVDATGRLSIDFEPVARFGTPTQLTIHLRRSQPGTESILLSNDFGEPLGLVQVLPQPVAQIARADGIELVFATPIGGGDTMMRMVLKPSSVGSLPFRVEADGASIRTRMLVMP